MSLRTTFPVIAALALASALVAAALLAHPAASNAEIGGPAAGPIAGWAWSDTIGWISLSCTNDDTCSTSAYGLEIESSGSISGYAWSDNVGWISAEDGDLTGCPEAPCVAEMSGSSMRGWLKVLSAEDSQSGGWDGWIRLKDLDYGPLLSNGVFSGYSWGDMNVGWVDWSLATTEYLPCVSQNICSGNNVVDSCTDEVVQACTGGLLCSAGACIEPLPPAAAAFGNFSGHLTAKPSLVRMGDTTKLYWNIENVVDSSCSVTGSNGDAWTELAFSGTSGKTTSQIMSRTVFTLTCTGVDNSTFTETATVNIIPVFQEQ